MDSEEDDIIALASSAIAAPAYALVDSSSSSEESTTDDTTQHMGPRVGRQQQQQPAVLGPRVLLGVTGSVAAVKSPEIAVRLVTEFNAHVRVLLTRGGQHFWNKAVDYDREYWEQLQSYSTTTPRTVPDVTTTAGVDPRIVIHSK
jgi:hypothetical protein